MITYYYNSNPYQTLEEAQAAASQMLLDLSTKPTLWCSVKRVTENSDGSYNIPVKTLADQEILNLEQGHLYSINSNITGDTLTGTSAEDTSLHVESMKKEFVEFSNLNLITAFGEIPTDADFSIYT